MARGCQISRHAAEGLLTIPDDAAGIEQIIREWNAVVVVFDVFETFLADKIDALKTHNIRRALGVMSKVARDTGACLIFIRHYTKGGADGPRIYRGGGSVGIVGTARGGVCVEDRAEHPGEHLFYHAKHNQTYEHPALAYRIEQREGDLASHIEWLGPVALSDAAAAEKCSRGRPKEQYRRAYEFLKRFNEEIAPWGGRVYSSVFGPHLKGISHDTVNRARKDLGIRAEPDKRDPANWVWVWIFPRLTDEPIPWKFERDPEHPDGYHFAAVPAP